MKDNIICEEDYLLIDEVSDTIEDTDIETQLLELYKELSKLKDDIIHSVMFGKDYEYLRLKTIEIEKLIKELEK